MKFFCKCILWAFTTVFAVGAAAQEPKGSINLVKDKLNPSQPHSVKISGYLGEKLDQCIHNRIMVQNVDTLLSIFKVKQKDNLGFNGEFYGKWSAAAALSLRYQPNATLQQKLDQSVKEFIKTQTTDGYLTTYKKNDEFKVWDVWNQKYVLLGLIAQYDLTGKKKELMAAQKSADHLMSVLGPGKISLEEYGPAIHKGGVNYTILEPIVLLYQRTHEQKYLAYAQYIVDSWSKPGKYTPTGARIIEDALEEKPLAAGEVLHAYTLMSCFEGLCELYRATGNKLYLEASIKVANNIKKQELMIAGSVSNHEMWYGGTVLQTEMLEMPIETCATATWMKLCYQLLRLTGNPQYADEMEISLYNALLGAMMPKGEWWAYNSPLNGERVPSRQQGSEISCCVSSGPRGLLITPEWAAMADEEGNPVINLFSPGTAVFKLKDGNKVIIEQETDYPVTNLITFHIKPDQPTSFALKLRIPAWSKQTLLKVNGEVVSCVPGSYAVINRRWSKDDQVTLALDLRGRIIRAPSGAPQQAIMRGPILLALDSRLTPEKKVTAWLMAQPYTYDNLISKEGKGYILPKYNFQAAGEDAYIDLKLVKSDKKEIKMVFEVPFFRRPTHFLSHQEIKLLMCDYASAGNEWSETNLFKVWLPQPMYMGNMYPRGMGIVLAPAKVRYTVPSYIQKVLLEK